VKNQKMGKKTPTPREKLFFAQTAPPEKFKSNWTYHDETRLTVFCEIAKMAKKGKQHLPKISRRSRVIVITPDKPFSYSSKNWRRRREHLGKKYFWVNSIS
jgi:uncharacterized HAD superfamily protein